jgi:hypothetical protein
VFFFGVSSAVGGYSSYRNGGCYFGCLLIGLINVVLFQYAVLFYDEQRWFFYGQQACATVQDASFLMFFMLLSPKYRFKTIFSRFPFCVALQIPFSLMLLLVYICIPLALVCTRGPFLSWESPTNFIRFDVRTFKFLTLEVLQKLLLLAFLFS